jgi:hypothetical protein
VGASTVAVSPPSHDHGPGRVTDGRRQLRQSRAHYRVLERYR